MASSFLRRSLYLLMPAVLYCTGLGAQVMMFNPQYHAYGIHDPATGQYRNSGIGPSNQYYYLDTVQQTLKHSWNYPGDKDDLRVKDMHFDAAEKAYVCELQHTSDTRYARAYVYVGASGITRLRMEKQKKGRAYSSIIEDDIYTDSLNTLAFDVTCDAYKFTDNVAPFSDKKDGPANMLAFAKTGDRACNMSFRVRPGKIEWLKKDSMKGDENITLEITGVEYIKSEGTEFVLWRCSSKAGYLRQDYNVYFGHTLFTAVAFPKGNYADNRAIIVTKKFIGAEVDMMILRQQQL